MTSGNVRTGTQQPDSGVHRHHALLPLEMMQKVNNKIQERCPWLIFTSWGDLPTRARARMLRARQAAHTLPLFA